MYNYSNLSDFEFEILCRDIMQKKLGIKLYTFQKGRDGGIDVTDDPKNKKVIIQVKHYINSKYSDLLGTLKKEVQKVKELQPEKYYICCALNLTAKNKRELYDMFSDYMESANDIMSLIDIDDFLECPENMDIVRKHYKLWLESTEILGEVFNQNVFIDCESLLYNIEEESRRFVETSCYYECLDILEKEKMLLLLGMPGTGKTVTTKMLAIYYASKGYRIRYTTNGDISDIKNAISTQKDLPEIILLDDCLGQHYFRMKETQGNELLSLVKYVACHKNKKLIMNSRVTIFQQAKERVIEFRQFAEDEKFKIKILDMGKLSLSDKGRIFHNHIYFKGLPADYYQDILKDFHYREIVKHNNYTPRIMEFVTREYNFKKVSSGHYYEYVLRCLDNPTEIWQDEFSEKLQQEDRVFLTTLYSLTDTSIDENVVKRAFNYRLSNNTIADTSRNIWEDVLKRLEGAFIQIIEKNGKKEIGAINPSVNDFLREYLQKNDIEREYIRKNATEYEQIKRGFSENMEDIIRAGQANLYHYANQNEEMYVILTYVCRLDVFHDNYKYVVERFFQTLPYGFFEGMMGRCEILIRLLLDKFDTFYHTYDCLDDSSLMEFFWSLNLDEFQTFIELAEKYDIDFFYAKYRDLLVETLDNAILAYMEDVEADDYYGDYDVSDLLKHNMRYNGYYEELDKQSVVNNVCEWIKEDVEKEVSEMIENLPQDILDKIRISKSNVKVDKSDVEEYIESYLEPSVPEYDHHEMDYDYGIIGEMDILDCIFK